MALVGGGAQAERCTVDEAHALGVPEQLDWAEAGGFPEVFSTAFDALWSQGSLTVGDRVLVTGAAGGVGTAGVQLAHAAGATVVASVRHPGSRPAVAALGADQVVDPAEVPDHGPYDLVLELVGGPALAGTLKALATGARVVVIGVGGGARIELDLLALMGSRARLSGSTLRARSRTDKGLVAAGVASHVLPLVASGRVRVPVCATFPMGHPAAGYDHFAAGQKVGKVVLVAP
jgi:NADPH:quinone reductase-like Zn-dependent oxidoreductase